MVKVYSFKNIPYSTLNPSIILLWYIFLPSSKSWSTQFTKHRTIRKNWTLISFFTIQFVIKYIDQNRGHYLENCNYVNSNSSIKIFLSIKISLLKFIYFQMISEKSQLAQSAEHVRPQKLFTSWTSHESRDLIKSPILSLIQIIDIWNFFRLQAYLLLIKSL